MHFKTNFMRFQLLALLMLPFIAFSQQTLSGNVKDSEGIPLPGATVIVEGTNNAVTADFDGNFSINIKSGDILVASYVGYESAQIIFDNQSQLSFVLNPDTQLDEVIITAQGIARQEKALGYAVTTIKAKDIESKPEVDITRILQGKIPGVQINPQGGFLGTQATVIIRSKNSISGSNQPLYIIDGAPIVGDRSFDIDPNNIASTTVLKGLAASTLYGQDGRNGVIIINTKTGSGEGKDEKFEVEVNQTTSFLTVANLPDFQNVYGQGADNTINTTFFGTWGARFNNQEVPHHLSIPAYNSSFPQYVGATDTYRAIPNNVNDFFKQGIGNVTSVSIAKSSEDSSVSFAFSKTDQTGYVDENKLMRDNFSFGSTTKLANKLKLNTSVLYNKTISTRPTRNFFTLLTWIPRNLDIHNLPFEDPNDFSSVYYRVTISNPRWQQKNTQFKEDSDRLFIKTALDYEISDKLKLSYLYSNDYYNEFNYDYQHKGGADNILGFYQTFDDKERITTHRLSLTGNSLQINDNIDLNFVTGLETKNQAGQFVGLYSEDQGVFGKAAHNNFRSRTAIEGMSELNTVGVYAQFEFDYEDYLYLTLAARNDWASTVAKENRSILYPSVSLSFLPSSLPSIDAGGNFYKFRASYGTSANFPGPYLLTPTLDSSLNAWTNQFSSGDLVAYNGLSGYLPNPDLKPELLKEYELGFEAKGLFDNLLEFDLSLYKRITEDQILSSALPNSTGFSSTTINAGRVDTDGIEASLTLNLFKAKSSDGFSWSMINNFTAYETTVVDIPVELINIGSVNYAIEGQPYGVFRGTFPVKDDAGNLLIHPDTGKIIFSDDVGLEDDLIGDPNEDFYFTNINTLTYKNFSLGVQLEYVHGGDIYSDTIENLMRRGVTRDTTDGLENSREGTYIIPGVIGDPNTGEAILDGNGDKIKNNTQIGANDLFFINLMDVDANQVYDASVFRVRNVSLTYAVPEKVLENSPFGSVVFTAQGNNLFFNAPNLPQYMNLDPETLGTGNTNSRGIDSNNDPSYKQYSIGVKLTF